MSTLKVEQKLGVIEPAGAHIIPSFLSGNAAADHMASVINLLCVLRGYMTSIEDGFNGAFEAIYMIDAIDAHASRAYAEIDGQPKAEQGGAA